MSPRPVVRVTYVGGYPAHVRQMLLSYITGEGALHRAVNGDVWPDPICPRCTYEADDVLAGVPWPCDKADPA